MELIKKKRLFNAMVSRFPAVLVSGTRSREREHLIRGLFPEKSFIDLSDRAVLKRAAQSPLTFLLAFPDGAIINDVELLPQMLRAVRHYVEKSDNMKGKWILLSTPDLMRNPEAADLADPGSWGLAVMKVNGLCVEELEAENISTSNPFQIMQTGQMPDLVHRDADKAVFLDRIVENDVRRFINGSNTDSFRAFLRAAAQFSGIRLSVNAIAQRSGNTAPTAKSWLGIMERTGLVRLADDGGNGRSGRLFFTDTGILCHLLGMETMQQTILGEYKDQIVRTFAFNELIRGRDNRQLGHNIGIGSNCDFTASWRRSYNMVLEPNVEVTEDSLRRAKEIGTGSAKTVILHLGDGTYTNSGIDCISFRDWEKLAEDRDYFS